MHAHAAAVVLRAPPQAAPQARSTGRARTALLAAGVGFAACSLVHHQQQRFGAPPQRAQRHGRRRQPRVNWLAVDALSGAVGEVASLVVLYPLDSLKVLCQARGASAAEVLAQLRRTPGAARQLYAGCGSAALCSAAIGAAYLLAFYSAKRLLGGAAAAARGRQRSGSGSGSSGSGSSGSGSSREDAVAVATAAGALASLTGSVFEAPMEMFKLRTQAGALQGSMLLTMVRQASTGGFASLYATYAAFMLKSIPYDVAELATYSQLCDWRAAAAAPPPRGGAPPAGWRGALGAALAAAPDSTGDMLIGAAAGVASVLVSMPGDVIKTRLDLMPPGALASGGGGGPLGAARAFAATGRALLAAGGPRALFVGVAPRLLQNVPSCMVYWAAVEGTRRFMLRHCDVAGGPEGAEAAPASAGGGAASAGSTAAGSIPGSSGSAAPSGNPSSSGAPFGATQAAQPVPALALA